MHSQRSDDMIEHLLKSDKFPEIPDSISMSIIKTEIESRGNQMKKKNITKYKKMGIIAAGVAIIGFCTPFIVSSRFTVDATPTPLGKLTIVKQSPALNELKNMNVQVSNSQIHAKVSAEEIINQLAQKQYFSEQKATTIEATYYVISRVPKELVNPNVISSDPVIKVSGDYLYNIPVWVIRFNGVHPPMSTGLGIHHSSPKQQAVDTVFDATTGKVIIGF